MRIAAAMVAVSITAGFILLVAPDSHWTNAALCLQPLAFFGPAVAAVVLILRDPPFRAYFVSPVANRKAWARALAAAAGMLLLSLLLFNWAMCPSAEVEGASIYWGRPLPWATSGCFYGGFGGDLIRARAGYAYIFSGTTWYENPRILGEGLLLDSAFFLAYSLTLFRLLDWTRGGPLHERRGRLTSR